MPRASVLNVSVMNSQSFVVILALLCLAAEMGAQDPPPVHDCGSVVGKFNSLEISGCKYVGNSYCQLKRGANVVFSLKFTTMKAEPKVSVVVYVTIGPLTVRFQLENSDACNKCGLVCPLSEQSEYVYRASFPILRAYPKMRADVKWELRDEDGNDIVCVIIPVKIV